MFKLSVSELNKFSFKDLVALEREAWEFFNRVDAVLKYRKELEKAEKEK